MKPFVRSLIGIGSLGAITILAGPALAEETGIAADMLQCQNVQTPEGSARSEAHGFVQLIDEALSQVNLQENQARALSQIGTQVDAKEAAVHDARRNLMLAIAQQMEAGQINRNALEPQLKALVEAKDAAVPAMSQALDQIHDTLTPEQRTKFADALEKSVEARRQMYSSGGWLNQWSKELGLSDQQKQQVENILGQLKPAMEQRHNQFTRVLSAFRGQSFRVEQIVPTSESAKETRQGAEQMVRIAQQIAQVLTPQQRALAAKKIAENACPKVQPPPTGAPSTGQRQQSLEGENVGSSQDEIIVGRGVGWGGARGYGFAAGRGLWGGYGGYGFRGINRFGYWPGYYGGLGYGAGYRAYGAYGYPGYGYGAYGYPYAASYAYPYAYNYAYPYAYTLGYPGYGGVWPGYSAFAYSYPYLGSYSYFW